MNKFNLKNYTSTVPVDRTVGQIESFLAAVGATHIAKKYDGGRLVGVDFAIEVETGVQLAFRLPVDVEAMFAYMRSMKKHRLTPAQVRTLHEQAERTAWKIMRDWVETQLSLAITQQADITQVFMAYALRGNETFYQVMKASSFAQLAAPKPQ